jgi:hypothetical protein
MYICHIHTAIDYIDKIERELVETPT